MAVSSLTSAPLVLGADLLSNSSVQLAPIGSYAETADGRGYRYDLVGGTATVAGKVYQGKALDATNDQPSGGISVAAAAIGDLSVTTTSTLTWSLNEFAGGYLAVVVTPGQGYTYKIKGNTAATSAVSTTAIEPVNKSAAPAVIVWSVAIIVATNQNSIPISPAPIAGSV